MIHSARKWLFRGSLAAVLLYWLALLVGTHTPKAVIATQGHGDKLLHLAAYGGLGLLLGVTFGLRRPLTWRVLALLLLCLALSGAVDELLQVPIPGRSGDPWDWAADCLGGLLGLLLAGGLLAVEQTWVQRRERGQEQ